MKEFRRDSVGIINLSRKKQYKPYTAKKGPVRGGRRKHKEGLKAGGGEKQLFSDTKSKRGAQPFKGLAESQFFRRKRASINWDEGGGNSQVL